MIAVDKSITFGLPGMHACTDSLTCKMMSEWAQSDVKRIWSINYTKNGNPKISGKIAYPPNITQENSEKYLGMGGN